MSDYANSDNHNPLNDSNDSNSSLDNKKPDYNNDDLFTVFKVNLVKDFEYIHENEDLPLTTGIAKLN